MGTQKTGVSKNPSDAKRFFNMRSISEMFSEDVDVATLQAETQFD
jgi:hypothetical protein